MLAVVGLSLYRIPTCYASLAEHIRKVRILRQIGPDRQINISQN
jgi:hypothetical protein